MTASRSSLRTATKTYAVRISLYSSTHTNQCSLVISDDAGKKKAPSGTLGNPVAVDDDGLLVDVDVQVVDDIRTTRADKRQDVDEFFLAATFSDMKGKSRKYRLCKICP